MRLNAISRSYYLAVTPRLETRHTVRGMTPLVNRIFGAVRPNEHKVGTCLVCRDAIALGDDYVRLSGGGQVHADCATYRMRHRGRAVSARVTRRRPGSRRRYTGD
jgi:hypothetical protein